MRKLVSVLLTVAVAVSLMVVPAVTSADGAPTIDGVISSGEWDGATEINVTSGINGTVKVLTSTDYLYMLLAADDSTDNRLGEGSGTNDKTSVNINPTDNASWGKPYDIIFEMGTDAASWGGLNAGNIDGYKTNWVIDDSQVTLPTDLEAKTVYTSGRKVTEWKIPLDTITGLSPGDTLKIGGCFDIDRGSTPHYYYPAGLVWANASTYADILISGNTAVGLTAVTPNITAIDVEPTNIDFGNITPGTPTDGDTITVENIGGVTVVVDAYLAPQTGTVFNYLKLKGSYSPSYSGFWDNIVSGLLPSQTSSLTTQLDVPSTYSGQGNEAAILVFEATAL